MSDLDRRDADRRLRTATLLYAGAFLLHNADHARRGFDVLTPQVLAAGTLQSVLSVAVVMAVLLRHRVAPVLATVAGFGSALGVSASHLLPEWSAFSDAFPGASVDALSWAAVLIEVTASLALGVAGALAVRAAGVTGQPASD